MSFDALGLNTRPQQRIMDPILKCINAMMGTHTHIHRHWHSSLSFWYTKYHCISWWIFVFGLLYKVTININKHQDITRMTTFFFATIHKFKHSRWVIQIFRDSWHRTFFFVCGWIIFVMRKSNTELNLKIFHCSSMKFECLTNFYIKLNRILIEISTKQNLLFSLCIIIIIFFFVFYSWYQFK